MNAVSWNVTSLPQDKKLEFNSEGAKAQCRLCRREDKREERETRRGSHSMYSQQQVKTELDLQDRMNVLAALNMFSFHWTSNVLSANTSMLQTNRMKKYHNPLWRTNKGDARCFHILLFCTVLRALFVVLACRLKSWISQVVLWICFYTQHVSLSRATQVWAVSGLKSSWMKRTERFPGLLNTSAEWLYYQIQIQAIKI